MNNDYKSEQNQQGQGPQDFGRSQEARQAWENGQTSWANQGTPYSNVPQTPNDPVANSAQTLGIVGLIVSIVCCALAGLILGIIAVSKAKMSRLTLGYEVPEARTGRICGIIAIVISIISMVASVIYTIVSIALGAGIFNALFSDLSAVVSFLPLL